LRGVDVWFDGHHLETLTTALVDTNTHGTGCTLAAAIAANLALDNELLTSDEQYVTTALTYALTLAKAQDLGHFSALWKCSRLRSSRCLEKWLFNYLISTMVEHNLTR